MNKPNKADLTIAMHGNKIPHEFAKGLFPELDKMRKYRGV